MSWTILYLVLFHGRNMIPKTASFYCFQQNEAFFLIWGQGFFHIALLLMEAHFPAAQGQTEGKGIQST